MADEVGNIFDEINKKADIVKVVSHYLGSSALMRKGNVYYSLCPFHKDSHPSFRVDPQRNTCKCFSCGTGANPISFAEKYAHLKPMEALKEVCNICGIPLPSQVSNYHEAPDLIGMNYKSELDALMELTKFYQMSLLSNDGKKGREYLESRQLPKDAIAKFKIGYAPSDVHASINALRKLGFEVKTLETAGIVSAGSDLKDRYQERIMFPLEDLKGRIVGFSGRTIEAHSEGGKYINYPATPLFNKSDVLYHFAAAREFSRKAGYLYVVEGFMDVIAFCRAGEEAVCGVMGTALTEEHCQVIKRLGVEVRLCLDRDEAGQSNEERCLALFKKFRIPCRVVRKFKLGKDADEVLTNAGPKKLLEEANSFYDPFLFFLGRALKGRKTLEDPVEITNFLNRSSEYFMDLPEASQAADLKILSRVTSFDVETLNRIIHHTEVKIEEKRNFEDKKEGGDYTWRKKRSKDVYTGPKVFNNITNAGTIVMSVCQNVLSLMQQTAKTNGVFNTLLKTESEIICAIPFAREGMKLLNDSVDMALKVYYSLSIAFSDFFVSNLEKKALTVEDFDSIIDYLSHEEKGLSKKEEDDESADFFFDSDLDDLEGEGFDSLDKLDESEKQLAINILKEIRKLTPDMIDLDNLKMNIEKESKLLQIYTLISESRLKNGGVVDNETKLKVNMMIRQNQLKIKPSEIF